MPRPSDDDDSGGGVVRAVQRIETAEIRRQVHDIDERLDEHDERLDAHAEKIGGLRESHARMDGEMQHLRNAYERAANVATSQALSDLEIKKADALAQIKDRGRERAAKRAERRELVFKAIALASGGVALLYSILQARC